MTEYSDLISLKTPSYLFFLENIRLNFEKIKQLLTDVEVFYSIKANAEIEILEYLNNIGSKFEVASGGEFFRLLKIGIPTSNIICSAPIKTESMIRDLYLNGCKYFSYSTDNEYEKLYRLAPNALKIARIKITDIQKDGISYGLTPENIKSHNFDGLTFHFSKHKTEYINKVFEIIFFLVDYKRKQEKLRTFIINLGGGYNKNLGDDFYKYLHMKLRDLKLQYSDINFFIYAEPGEAIVKSGGYFLTKVIDIVEDDLKTNVYIDGGFPSGYSIAQGRLINITDEIKLSKRKIYDFYDISCLHKSLFLYAYKGQIKINDKLLFDQSGAYTTCYINRFHLWESPSIYTYPKEFSNV